MAADNTSLGTFNLEGLPPAPRGIPKIDVTFDIDANGILNVTAVDQATRKSQSIRITGSTRLPETDKQRMIKDAESYAEQDRKRREEVEKLNTADALCYQAEKTLVDFGDKLSTELRSKIETALRETREAYTKHDATLAAERADKLQRVLQEVGKAIYTQNAEQSQTTPPAGFFDRFFGRRRTGPRPGANLEVDLVVPLTRILTGGEEMVRLTHPAICAACNGSGAKAGTQPRPCPTCGGTGQKVERQQRGALTVQQITTCPTCHGQRLLIDSPCPVCSGRGRIEREEELSVKIPPGAEEGMALRIPGRGEPSATPGAPPGDLYVVVSSTPDPRFHRRGADLWCNEVILDSDAALGTEVALSTLDGVVTVTVPPGTQPGAVLRLRGKGLPEFGSSQRGDLYLTISVSIPEKLTKEQRALYERLRQLQRH